MPYQSPISPGISWYEDTAGPRPQYPALDGDRQADVVIIGLTVAIERRILRTRTGRALVPGNTG